MLRTIYETTDGDSNVSIYMYIQEARPSKQFVDVMKALSDAMLTFYERFSFQAVTCAS